MSKVAETFDTNQQKLARELRHSKESASAKEMSNDDDDDAAEPHLQPEPEPEHGS